jgi:hypothetical protein
MWRYIYGCSCSCVASCFETGVIMDNKQYIEHEVRIRIQEQNAIDIKNALSHLENKMDSRFMLLIGLIMTSIVLPVLLHVLKLV